MMLFVSKFGLPILFGSKVMIFLMKRKMSNINRDFVHIKIHRTDIFVTFNKNKLVTVYHWAYMMCDSRIFPKNLCSQFLK